MMFVDCNMATVVGHLGLLDLELGWDGGSRLS